MSVDKASRDIPIVQIADEILCAWASYGALYLMGKYSSQVGIIGVARSVRGYGVHKQGSICAD